MTDYSPIEKALGYEFSDKKILERALTHSSYAHEHRTESYERLEFLGDAVLDYIAALNLFEMYPDKSEGDMTKIRASLVDKKTLADICEKLNLTDYIRFSEGTQTHSILQSVKVKCDIFEAVIGAILIDSNKDISIVRGILERILTPHLTTSTIDYKSVILENFAQNGIPYSFVFINDKESKDADFTVELQVKGKRATIGNGSSKKDAQLDACKKYYQLIFKK